MTKIALGLILAFSANVEARDCQLLETKYQQMSQLIGKNFDYSKLYASYMEAEKCKGQILALDFTHSQPKACEPAKNKSIFNCLENHLGEDQISPLQAIFLFPVIQAARDQSLLASDPYFSTLRAADLSLKLLQRVDWQKSPSSSWAGQNNQQKDQLIEIKMSQAYGFNKLHSLAVQFAEKAIKDGKEEIKQGKKTGVAGGYKTDLADRILIVMHELTKAKKYDPFLNNK